MGILQLLAKENYIAYSKPLAQKIGIDEAILFGELCSMCNLYGDTEFFCEQQRLCDDTCLTEYRVRNALKNLKAHKLVRIVKKGLPAKNYYTLDENRFLEILDCHRTSGVKIDTTGSDKNYSTSSIKSDSTFNKNQISKNEDIKNQIKYIVEYLNQKAGKSFRSTGKDTQKHINARLAEGFTVEGFKKVIDTMCAKWKGTEMDEYLRPSTLFGPKFESYLNANINTKQAKKYGSNGIAISSEENHELDGIL